MPLTVLAGSRTGAPEWHETCTTSGHHQRPTAGGRAARAITKPARVCRSHARVRQIARRKEAHMYQTKNDLPAQTRADVIVLLNARLADSIDLMHQAKQ